MPTRSILQRHLLVFADHVELGVALQRHATGLPDHRGEPVFRHRPFDVIAAGSVDDLLVHHDRAVQVVRPEREPELRNLWRLRDPVGHYVRDVVQKQPPDGDVLEILGSARARQVLQARVIRMEGERDKGPETTGTVLEVPQAQHMVDLALRRLYVTVEHRGIGLHAQVVRGLVDLDPSLPGALGPADGTTALPVEDLCPPPRQAPYPGLAQLLQDLPYTLPTQVGKSVDLNGGPSLYMDVGVCPVQLPDDVQVHVEAPLGVYAADDVELRNAREVHPRQLMQRLLRGPLVTPLVALGDPEGAEAAAVHADVRRVEPVLVREVCLVAVETLPHVIGETAHLGYVVRFEELESILEGEPLTRIDFLPDLRQISRRTYLKHLFPPPRSLSPPGWPAPPRRARARAPLSPPRPLPRPRSRSS